MLIETCTITSYLDWIGVRKMSQTGITHDTLTTLLWLQTWNWRHTHNFICQPITTDFHSASNYFQFWNFPNHQTKYVFSWERKLIWQYLDQTICNELPINYSSSSSDIQKNNAATSTKSKCFEYRCCIDKIKISNVALITRTFQKLTTNPTVRENDMSLFAKSKMDV